MDPAWAKLLIFTPGRDEIVIVQARLGPENSGPYRFLQWIRYTNAKIL